MAAWLGCSNFSLRSHEDHHLVRIRIGVQPLGIGLLESEGGDPPSLPDLRRAREKSHESIKAAFDAGSTLFDLSDVDSDGLVEEVFGRTLKEVSEMRDRIVIATKCGIR